MSAQTFFVCTCKYPTGELNPTEVLYGGMSEIPTERFLAAVRSSDASGSESIISVKGMISPSFSPKKCPKEIPTTSSRDSSENTHTLESPSPIKAD